ncbi:D-alanyl-D-alanine carboxypeptidase family protein [Romboutsia maritimum]|uniref:D-alanyl-D-alanine carboxypeptidase family protein n=1 Tax=Romboutsia maritimum TaxID=2020948 RepID=A0A371IQB6_9FIRM|nr:M15 family metallopeptidase [Romboutsia maritimum]RDY22666.1 D-alanyl-D-alanine carboxypeptidase family protein [Romboutsia maritimum]
MKKIMISGILILATTGMFIMKDQGIPLEMNKNTKSNIMLVNKNNSLPDGYVPKDLVKPNIKFIDSSTEEEKQLNATVANAIEDLFSKAKEEGIIFLGTSAYRSYETQKEVYQSRVKSQGIIKANQYVAKPGTSEHQTGLCIDLTNKDRWFVEATKEATWLKENAHEFGFIIRYPKSKEAITQKEYEPWHIRYVGKDIASDIYNNNLTLEEYSQEK